MNTQTPKPVATEIPHSVNLVLYHMSRRENRMVRIMPTGVNQEDSGPEQFSVYRLRNIHEDGSGRWVQIHTIDGATFSYMKEHDLIEFVPAFFKHYRVNWANVDKLWRSLNNPTE